MLLWGFYLYNYDNEAKNVLLDGFGWLAKALWFSCSQSKKKLFGFPIIWLSVPDDGYSKNLPCSLNYISTFLVEELMALFINRYKNVTRFHGSLASYDENFMSSSPM